jgi:D-arabinose 1-dehydrogenase-like Zn-dependent alcohol dehydrogenase
MHGTMKAARLHGFERTHGSSEVVHVDDVPIPDIESGEVLIRVLRAGLNHGDLHMREDAVQYSPEVKTVPDLPMTIGHDGLGQIVEVGRDVENLRVGDRVVVICSITCGFCKFCRTERQHLCQTKKTMGFLTKWGEGPAYLRRYKDGLWAEYCRVPAATWFVSLLMPTSTKCARSRRSTSVTARSNGRVCIVEKSSWSTAPPGLPA